MTIVKKEKGFSLIELLVVIAIIGILSSVVLTSLSTARGKARVAAVEQTLHSVQTAAHVCLNDGELLDIPDESVDGGLSALCTGSVSSYSLLPAGWIYCDDDITVPTQSDTNCGNDASGPNSTTAFIVMAESNLDATQVICDQNACQTVVGDVD